MAEALDPAIPDDIERLAQEVLQEACERELMLAAAESCTGGLLASLLTDIPGKSHAFERGFVTYSDDAKHELLGVSRRILESDGAVSEASARAMAEGAITASRADLAVSITGFCEGPGAGLVHLACARREGPTDHRLERFGDVGRAEVRLRALRVALQLFREALRQLAKAA
jgi:nicotinamide-nucleotide amidase